MIWRSLAIIILFGLGGMLGIWVRDRADPVTFVGITALTPIVAPGGILKIRYDVYRHQICELKVQRMIFDAEHVHYPLPDRDYLAAPGKLGSDWYVVAVQVPKSTALGRASYQMATNYVCNPVHRLWPIVTQSRDVFFTVAGDPA